MLNKVESCRICGNKKLVSLLNLGEQSLTGIFPKTRNQQITSGPLELIKCDETEGKACGLVQLRHSYALEEMYGDNYGYRSGLNRSMVEHLKRKVADIEKTIELQNGDLILDIGSNDSTLLQSYPKDKFLLVGIDPTGKKFKSYYPEYITLIPEFFSTEIFKSQFGGRKAKVVTSIAMFYDLESPLSFMRDVYEVLADDGIWIFEQSYMPKMLEMNAYDTICHEHLEYYALKQIKWLTDRAGFIIIDVEFNDINGGSFSIKAAKKNSPFREASSLIDDILGREKRLRLFQLRPYEDFKTAIYKHKDALLKFLRITREEGKLILGYGASTKGNVILQFCDIGESDIPFIAEVNQDKFGCFTPGTKIPIISEQEARAMKPDYFVVLPWHFKSNIIKREHQYLNDGGKLVFPLPRIEVVDSTQIQ